MFILRSRLFSPQFDGELKNHAQNLGAGRAGKKGILLSQSVSSPGTRTRTQAMISWPLPFVGIKRSDRPWKRGWPTSSQNKLIMERLWFINKILTGKQRLFANFSVVRLSITQLNPRRFSITVNGKNNFFHRKSLQLVLSTVTFILAPSSSLHSYRISRVIVIFTCVTRLFIWVKSISLWACTTVGRSGVDTEVGTAAITLGTLVFICWGKIEISWR